MKFEAKTVAELIKFLERHLADNEVFCVDDLVVVNHAGGQEECLLTGAGGTAVGGYIGKTADSAYASLNEG